MRFRITLLAVVVAALSLVGVGVAHAAITALTVNPSAQLSADRTMVTVTGTVTCTFGDSVQVSAQLFQSSGRILTIGTGSSGALSCIGAPQLWTAVAPALVGAYKPGPANVLVSAFDTTDGTSTQTSANLKLGH